MRTIALLVTSVLLLLSGCGAATSTDDTSAGNGAGDDGASAPLIGTGKQADYDFAAETVEGTTLEGSSLEGSPAVLWFWSPWCPTCRAQSPNVSALAEAYEGEVAIVGVGGLDNAAAISELAERIPNVTHVVDDEGEIWQHFGVTAQSTYTVINAEGEIITEGFLDDGDLNDMVARLAVEAS